MSIDSELDAELDAAGARWRAELDADPSLDELFASTQVHRRRAMWPMLAAAAVVVAVSVAAVAIGTRHGSSPPPATAAAGCAHDFSATVTAPSPMTPVTPVTTAQPPLPALLRLRYDGHAPCRMSAAVGAVDVLRHGAADAVVPLAEAQNGVFAPVVVRPGETFAMSLTWTSYCSALPPTGLRVRFVDDSRGIAIPIDALEQPGCTKPAAGEVALAVTDVVPVSDSATLDVGIRYVGGPAPGSSPLLRAGSIVVALGSDPYRTASVPDGGRSSITVAAGTYRVTATSGDAQCVPQAVAPTAGAVLSVTVLCSVR